jgi:hypothetical protein
MMGKFFAKVTQNAKCEKTEKKRSFDSTLDDQIRSFWTNSRLKNDHIHTSGFCISMGNFWKSIAFLDKLF